jgi:hypothetical protein
MIAPPLRLGSAAAGGARSAAGSPTPLAHPAPARGEKVRLYDLSAKDTANALTGEWLVWEGYLNAANLEGNDWPKMRRRLFSATVLPIPGIPSFTRLAHQISATEFGNLGKVGCIQGCFA